MDSFTFLLCSTLLICSVIALPYPGDDAAAAPGPELNAKIDEQAEKTAKKVLQDVAKGEDVHESLLHRSMDMAQKILSEVQSIGHSAMKRWNEIQNGDSIGDVAGRWWHSMVRKVSGKNESFDKLVKKFGSDNIKDFIKSAANLIKSIVTPSVSEGKELKENEAVVNKEAEAKLTELAEDFKKKAE